MSAHDVGVIAGALRATPYVSWHCVARWRERYGDADDLDDAKGINVIKHIVATGIEVDFSTGPWWINRYRPGFRYFLPGDGGDGPCVVVKDGDRGMTAITILTQEEAPRDRTGGSLR